MQGIVAATLNGPFNLPTMNPIDITCTIISKNNDATTAFLQKLNNALQNNDATKKFPNTVAYIKATNTAQLAASVDSCKGFFNGLLGAFKTDLPSTSQANAQQTLLDLIKKQLPMPTH